MTFAVPGLLGKLEPCDAHHVPYRDTAEDPRIDAARRRHTGLELANVRAIVMRLTDELERSASADVAAAAALDDANQGRRRSWFVHQPSAEELQRDLAVARELRAIAAAVLVIARGRESMLAAMGDTSSEITSDPKIEALAVRASIRAAVALARNTRAAMLEAARLVTQAHGQEMSAALSGHPPFDPALPRANSAVAVARCHVELLRAGLVEIAPDIGGTTLGDVIAKLAAAGSGPGQEWKDRVLAAAPQLEVVVETLERA